MEADYDLPFLEDKQIDKILTELCDKHQVPVTTFKQLVCIIKQHQHRGRADGITNDFNNAFNEWQNGE